MSMYNNAEELETIARACATVSTFTNLMFECAWKYTTYDRRRIEANNYIESHASGRPTKERERLQVSCSRKYGEFWATLQSLQDIASAFGEIHVGTIHDEVIEILAASNC